MKISGVKVQFGFDVGEVDIDLKDVLDLMRLDHEHTRELRRECRECETIRKPSSETKQFVEAIVGKAVMSIKEQIKESIKGKIRPSMKGGRDVDPDERIDE